MSISPRSILNIRCYWCNTPADENENLPCCPHPEITKEVVEAAQILDGVNFCDHFCCGMPENICRAVRLAAALKERK